MNQTLLHHFQSFGLFTYPGAYREYLESLPDDVKEIGELLRRQIIHRTTLRDGNTGSNADLKYGDMEKVPWYRQAEDDNLVTASSMISELFRRDERGFQPDRAVENKVILTCRHMSILMASILKTKGFACRVRAGFAPYFSSDGTSGDHWVNEYWDEAEQRWVVIDVDGSWHEKGFDMYDIPEDSFDQSPDAWLQVRAGEVDENHFTNAGGYSGLSVIAWELFYDFHAIMNSEIIYLHHPAMAMYHTFVKLPESELQRIDHLAKLLTDIDANFDELLKIWKTEKDFRLLKGGLL